MKCSNKDIIPSRKESQLKYPDGISDNILKPIMTKSKSSHQNKKTLSPFYPKNYRVETSFLDMCFTSRGDVECAYWIFEKK